MFKIILLLVVISQCCSPSVFASPVKDSDEPNSSEEDLSKKPFNSCGDYIGYVNGHVEDTPDYTKTGTDLNFLRRIFGYYFDGNNQLTSSEIKAQVFLALCPLHVKENDASDTGKDSNPTQLDHFPPRAPGWNKDEFVLSASLGIFNRIGEKMVFEFEVDKKDEKREFYLKPVASKDFSLGEEPENFARVFEYFGYTNDEILEVKTDFAELQQHLKEVDTTEDYNAVTVGWIKEHIPDFDWAQYFNIVACDVIKDTDEIHVQKNVMKNIIELLSKTDKKKVTNYILYYAYRQAYAGHIRSGKDECYEAACWFFPDVFMKIALKLYANA